MLRDYGWDNDGIRHTCPLGLSCWEVRSRGSLENGVNGGKPGVRKVMLGL